MSLAVFDIDGVVADVRHRLVHLQGRDGHHDWAGFFAGAAADPLLDVGARLAHELAAKHEIVWLTGRPAWLEPVTRDWLSRHELPGTEVHLRPRHDRRPAPLLKVGVLHQLAPRRIAAVIDDDDEVVQAAVAAGFPAVLADWVPRTEVLRRAQDGWGRT